MPKVLTERYQSSNSLKYIKESGTRNENGKSYIGRLEGVGASWKEPTRNGRLYSRRLWENVQNSDEFKEGMATKTIFGEADHPETRADTSIKEIAVVLTDFEIKDNGDVFTGFDILDTPNGRIIKELLDYGCSLGVSSRGLGEEVMLEGKNQIDPDTYEFFGFDVVVTPAVTKARPTVVESVESDSRRKSLVESVIREIENATSPAEVESIKRITESVNLPDNDSVKESINKKLNSIGDNNIISELKSNLENAKNEVANLKKQLEKANSKLNANNIRLEKRNALLKETKEVSSEMSKHLQNQKVMNSKLSNELYDSSIENDELAKKLESMKSKYDSKCSELSSLSRKFSKERSKNESLISEKKEVERKLKIAQDYNKKLVDESVSIKRSNKELQRQLNESKLSEKKKLTESRNVSRLNESVSRKLENTTKYAQKVTLEYLKAVSSKAGVSPNEVRKRLPNNYKLEDIDREVSKLVESKSRINKLPFSNSISSLGLKVESLANPTLTPEDEQTIRVLEGVKNKNQE